MRISDCSSDVCSSDLLTDALAAAVKSWGLSKVELLVVIVVIYTILGMLLDSIGMIVITVPLLSPILQSYGIYLVWFAVLLVVLIEIGQITPLLGLKQFVFPIVFSIRL